MRGARVYRAAVLALALGTSGCGSSAEGPRLAPPAEPRTLELGWVERSTSPAFVYHVDRFTVGRDGWAADVAVRNATKDDFQIRRPHRPGGPLFGLVLLETTGKRELRELTASFRKDPPFLEPERISPPLPASLRAGATWRGRLSGGTVLRRGTVVRVLFGRFVGVRPPQIHTWVTDHAVRL